MVNIIWFIYITILALAIGLRMVRLLDLKMQSLAEKTVFSLSLGLAVLSYLTFIVGVSGLLYRWIVGLILLILTVIFLPELKAILDAIFLFTRTILKTKKINNTETYLFLFFFFIFALITFIEAFAPVWIWDSLSYHMASAKIYIANHKIISIPYIVGSNWPAGIDMLYLLGLLLRSNVLSQLFSWLITITLTLSIFALALRYFSNRIAQLSVLVFCSTPLVNLYAAETYVDLGTALFMMLSVYAFMNWINTNQKNWLIISAINCGLSGWSKLTGILFIPLLLLGILLWGLKNKHRLKELFRNIFLVFLISLIIASAWYIKSWIATGNPVFPWLYSFFGGKNWNEMATVLHNRLLDELRTKTVLDFILVPLRWTQGTSDASIGPLFLVLIPVTLLHFRSLDRNTGILLIASFMIFVPFVLITNQPRLCYVVFALCSIVVGYELNRLWPKTKLLGFAIVILVFIATFIWNLEIKKAKLLTAIGKLEKEEFLIEKTPFYRQIQWINKNVPLNARILIWSIQGYYLDREYVWVSPVSQGYIDFSKVRDAKSLLSRMRELNITHIFYVPNERTSRTVMPGFLDNLVSDLRKTGKLTLVKRWDFKEILAEGNVLDTYLYSITY